MKNNSMAARLILSLFFLVLLLPVIFSECTPSWQCEDWTVCYKGSQSQTCKSSCGSPSVSYELRSCGEVIVPVVENKEEVSVPSQSSMTGMYLGLSNTFVYALLADVILLVFGVMVWKWKHIEPHFKKRSR